MSFNWASVPLGEQEPSEKAQATDHFNNIFTKLSIWRSHFIALLPLQMLVFKMSRLSLHYKGRELWDKNKHFGKERQKSNLSFRLGPIAMLLLLWVTFFTPGLPRRLSTGRGKYFPQCQKVKKSIKLQNNSLWGLLGSISWELHDDEIEVGGEEKLFLNRKSPYLRHTYGMQYAACVNAYFLVTKEASCLCPFWS